MILVVSDYHGREYKVLDLIDKYKPERVYSLGDQESDSFFLDINDIIAVKGNCDYLDLPKYIVITIKDHKLLLTHGHLYEVRSTFKRLVNLALELGCDYVLYGHTHIQRMDVVDGITLINPGSLVNDNYLLIDGDNYKLM